MRKSFLTFVVGACAALPLACLASSMQAEPFIGLRGVPGYSESQLEAYNQCFFKKCAPDNTPASNPGGFPAVLSCSQTCMMSVGNPFTAPAAKPPPAPAPKKTEPKPEPAPVQPASPACADGMQKLSDGSCAVVCPASEHKTRKSPTECGCERLYKMSGDKECVWSVESGFTFDGDSRDVFQEKVEKLGPNEGTFIDGHLANGRSFKVGVLRLPDGSYVYTNDGTHYFTDLKKAVQAGLLTRIGEDVDNLWSGLGRLIGIGKYTGKDTAGEGGKQEQEDGQLALNASMQTQQQLEASIGDPAARLEVAKDMAKQWGDQLKIASTGDKDEVLKEVQKQTGIDADTVKKALAGDAKGVGDDVLAKVYEGIGKQTGVDIETVKKAMAGDKAGVGSDALEKLSKAFKDKTGLDPESVKKALKGDYSGLKGNAIDKLFAGIKEESGVDVPFIKDALKGDFSSLTDGLAEKLTTFPADSVVILAKELRSASFANAVRVYIREREGGTSAAQTAVNPPAELDYVSSIQGVSQQYVNGGLFVAYEEAYQRYLIARQFKKK